MCGTECHGDGGIKLELPAIMYAWLRLFMQMICMSNVLCMLYDYSTFHYDLWDEI